MKTNYSKWKRFMSLGLSFFALSVGSIGLAGCEAEPQGDAEELGEDVDEAAEDVQEGAEDVGEDIEDEVE